MFIHTGVGVPCEICNKMFARNIDVKKHMVRCVYRINRLNLLILIIFVFRLYMIKKEKQQMDDNYQHCEINLRCVLKLLFFFELYSFLSTHTPQSPKPMSSHIISFIDRHQRNSSLSLNLT